MDKLSLRHITELAQNKKSTEPLEVSQCQHGFWYKCIYQPLETLKLLLMISLVPTKVGNSIENSWIKLGRQKALLST